MSVREEVASLVKQEEEEEEEEWIRWEGEAEDMFGGCRAMLEMIKDYEQSFLWVSKEEEHALAHQKQLWQTRRQKQKQTREAQRQQVRHDAAVPFPLLTRCRDHRAD